MAAIIRVKRSLKDESLEALYLDCKRQKINENNENNKEDLKSVLKFAGTISSPNQDISNLIKPHIKQELQNYFKTHNTDIRQKLKQQKQLDTKEKRYKIINLSRSNVDNTKENLEKESITFFDVERINNENLKDKKDNNFVYDLYYGVDYNLDKISLDDIDDIFINTYDGESYNYRGNNDVDSDDDSEDSNAENYFTNDYPDESDVESINEDDMIKAMKHFDLGNELSSDEEDYGENNEESLNDYDVILHGKQYAKFKATVLNYNNREDEVD